MPSTIPPDDVGLLPPVEQEPDAHGQAALLLAESMLHALIENGTMSAQDGVSVIDTACEVKVEVATLAGESPGRMQASLDLLTKMKVSFESYLD